MKHRIALIIGGMIVGVLATAAPAQAGNPAVPGFNPDEPINLDEYGSETRPDEYTLEQAFTGAYDAIDRCVAAEKKRSRTRRLAGEAGMSVLLNPDGYRPLGINARMPKKYKKNRRFTECLRRATASAPYPSYDGPPLVVDFDFELDPGYVEE